METHMNWLLTVILGKCSAEIAKGRTIQVMVEMPQIRRYMSNDLSTVIYKGIV